MDMNIAFTLYKHFFPRRQHYVNLIPNTLYSVGILGCFGDYFGISSSDCTVGNSSGIVFIQYLGFVSTRPLGEDFVSHTIYTIHSNSNSVLDHCSLHIILIYIVPTCYIEAFDGLIEITFQWNSGSNTGPLPHGYEVIVWQEERDDTKKIKSVNYFPAVALSTYRVAVDGLTSNMEYLVQVRANGSHIPNMKSAWVETRVKTLPRGELR